MLRFVDGLSGAAILSGVIRECADCNSIILPNVEYCYVCRQTRGAIAPPPHFVGASFEEYKERLEGKEIA
jgi:hypothetical protein